MVVLAFVVYALHHFFIAHWVAGAARWSASTLADMGYEHAAYYAGLGWVNSDIFYWVLYFMEIGIIAFFIKKGMRAQASQES